MHGQDQRYDGYVRTPHGVLRLEPVKMAAMNVPSNDAGARRARTARVKARLEEVLVVAILAGALVAIWGAILTLAITLIARGLGL